MAENPRLGSDLVRSAAFSKSEAIDSSNSSMRASQAVTDVAQKLAAHGVGAASLDLALDLVLHDVAEQARETTGATGAAIALIKDDQMICRATAGENAPDLGFASKPGRVWLRSASIQEKFSIAQTRNLTRGRTWKLAAASV